MPERHQDWLRQAQRDLEYAQKALADGFYEWACFAAQQSAEKGLKSLFLKANQTAWGLSVAGLLEHLPEHWQADETLIDAGKELDKHYIPPRYPNSLPEGAPFEYYTRGEAERAIAYTRKILAFCESLLAEPGPGARMPEEGSPPPGGETPGN